MYPAAMSEFSHAQDEWSKTWPDDVDEGSFRMWVSFAFDYFLV
jgi:hypothetical protein